MSTVKVTRNTYEHHESVLCQCGCKAYFDAMYHTRRPRYAPGHKPLADRAKRAKRATARQKSMRELVRIARNDAKNMIREMKATNMFPGIKSKQAWAIVENGILRSLVVERRGFLP